MRLQLLAIALLSAPLVQAQQLPLYSQYLFNGMVINPAYAGSKSLLNVNASYRGQWMNIDGSPATQTLSIDGSARKHMGYGFQVENDQQGAQGDLALLATYAYRLWITEESRLAFGVSGGVARSSLNKDALNTVDPNDPLIQGLSENKWRPDARFGMFYNTSRFYAGLSVANLFSNIVSNEGMITTHRHYFLNTGYLFTINEKVKLKPGVMIREDFNAPTNIDLNAYVLLDDKLWLGSTYRTGTRAFHPNLSRGLVSRDAVVVAAQYYVSNGFRIGYSYDFDIAGLRSFNTHEISLGYYFMKKGETPTVDPRYF